MASKLAKQAAAKLFTDGTHARASRLVLEFPQTKLEGYSGWSEKPVADQIDSVLGDIREQVNGALLSLESDHIKGNAHRMGLLGKLDIDSAVSNLRTAAERLKL